MSAPTTAMRATFAQIDREWPHDIDSRIAAKIAFLDAQSGAPADDLRALRGNNGERIDRADVRWAAVRGYLREQREDATFALNRVLILAFAAGMAAQSAAARRRDGWPGWLDAFDAVARIKRSFGPRAAEIVADVIVPSSLRDGA